MEGLEKLSLSELIEERVKTERAVVTFDNEACLSKYEEGFDESYEKARQMRVCASEFAMEIRKRLIALDKLMKGEKI